MRTPPCYSSQKVTLQAARSKLHFSHARVNLGIPNNDETDRNIHQKNSDGSRSNVVGSAKTETPAKELNMNKYPLKKILLWSVDARFPPLHVEKRNGSF